MDHNRTALHHMLPRWIPNSRRLHQKKSTKLQQQTKSIPRIHSWTSRLDHLLFPTHPIHSDNHNQLHRKETGIIRNEPKRNN